MNETQKAEFIRRQREIRRKLRQKGLTVDDMPENLQLEYLKCLQVEILINVEKRERKPQSN